MGPWKWIWSYIAPIAITSLWGFGALMVSEKSFLGAELLFVTANVLLAIRIITAPQIDDGQRVAIITFVILLVAGFSFMGCAWIEERKTTFAASRPPESTQPTPPTIVPVPGSPKPSFPKGRRSPNATVPPTSNGSPTLTPRPNNLATISDDVLKEKLTKNIKNLNFWLLQWENSHEDLGIQAFDYGNRTINPDVTDQQRAAKDKGLVEQRKRLRYTVRNPRDRKSMIDTASELRSEVLNHRQLLTEDIKDLPPAAKTDTLFAKFRTEEYEIMDLKQLVDYMGKLQKDFDASRK